MRSFKAMRVGLRVLKTAISAGISMFVVQLLGLDYPSLAVVAAIITLQPTIHETVDMSKRRLGGTIVGCVLGVIFAALFPENPFVMAIGIVLILAICNFFKWQSASALACVVFASIIAMPGGGSFYVGVNRVINTFIGISFSIVINWIFPAAPVDKYASVSLQRVFSKILLLLCRSLEQFTNGIINKIELNSLSDEISFFFEKADEATVNFKKETRYLNLDTYKLSFCEKNYRVLWNAYIYTAQIANDVTMHESFDLLTKEFVSRLENIIMSLRRIEPVLIQNMNALPMGVFDDINDNIEACLLQLENQKKELVSEYTFEHISYFLNIITTIQLVIQEFMQLSGDDNEENCSGIY